MTLLPKFKYGYLKHPCNYEKERCQDCNKDYTKDYMLQKKNEYKWRCIRCHNFATKEAA
mgnify:FL=1|jgi:hypothetical protein